MSRCRRLRVPGASDVFTVNLARRGDVRLVARIDALRAAFAATMASMPVRCDAMVVLPDRLHAVWTLPEGDADLPTRWRLLKHRFSRAVGDVAAPSDSRVRQGERGVWQRRYWERCIRDEAEWRAAVRY